MTITEIPLASDRDNNLRLEMGPKEWSVFRISRGSSHRAAVAGLTVHQLRAVAHRILEATGDAAPPEHAIGVALGCTGSDEPDVELSFVQIAGEPEVQLHITGGRPISFPNRVELAQALSAISGLAGLDWVTRDFHRAAIDREEALLGQIDHLGAVIVALGIDEPTADEDSITCAIRLLRAAYVDAPAASASDDLPGVASPYLDGARLGRAADFHADDWECCHHVGVVSQWRHAENWDGAELVQARQRELAVLIPRQLAADLDVGNLGVEEARDVILAAIKVAFAHPDSGGVA